MVAVTGCVTRLLCPAPARHPSRLPQSRRRRCRIPEYCAARRHRIGRAVDRVIQVQNRARPAAALIERENRRHGGRHRHRSRCSRPPRRCQGCIDTESRSAACPPPQTARWRSTCPASAYSSGAGTPSNSTCTPPRLVGNLPLASGWPATRLAGPYVGAENRHDLSRRYRPALITRGVHHVTRRASAGGAVCMAVISAVNAGCRLIVEIERQRRAVPREEAGNPRIVVGDAPNLKRRAIGLLQAHRHDVLVHLRLVPPDPPPKRSRSNPPAAVRPFQ